MKDFISKLKSKEEKERIIIEEINKQESLRHNFIKKKEEDELKIIRENMKKYKASFIPEYSKTLGNQLKNETKFQFILSHDVNEEHALSDHKTYGQCTMLFFSHDEKSSSIESFYNFHLELSLNRFFIYFNGLSTKKSIGGPDTTLWSKSQWKEIEIENMSEKHIDKWFKYVIQNLKSHRPYLFMHSGRPPKYNLIKG
jgi:hypothetical protein